jgi:hypothetical protein
LNLRNEKDICLKSRTSVHYAVPGYASIYLLRSIRIPGFIQGTGCAAIGTSGTLTGFPTHTFFPA